MRFAGSDSAMQSMFGNMSNYTPGVIQDMGTKALSSMKQAETEADFMTSKAGIDAEALVKGAEYGAEAIKAQGKAQGQTAGNSSLMSGISSGISGIMGGIGSMGTSGGAMPASYGASTFGGTDIGNRYAGAFTPGGSLDFGF
tara:strand:- start:266 stop:691 length:426 start_codon:yes stop_codon:yes gene_type:complete